MIRSYPAVTGQEDGVALDVAVDDALSVQVAQSPQHRQAHRRDLLLVHPGGDTNTDVSAHHSIRESAASLEENLHGDGGAEQCRSIIPCLRSLTHRIIIHSVCYSSSIQQQTPP